MKYTKKILEDKRVQINLSLDAKEWEDAVQAAYEKNKGKYSVQGFRKGETVRDFIFLGYKITADGGCSHESKRCLLLGRKAMTNLDRILKSRGITLPTKVQLVKAMFFPVVMYGYEGWSINLSAE